MIAFDLRCGRGHVFEAWFASSSAYEDQRERRLVSCPYCDDQAIEKAVMAPNIVTGRSDRDGPSQAERKALIATLADAQARLIENSTYVGGDFADRARAMSVGDEKPAPIYGEATASEAKGLADEGIAIARLPFPVVPPSASN